MLFFAEPAIATTPTVMTMDGGWRWVGVVFTGMRDDPDGGAEMIPTFRAAGEACESPIVALADSTGVIWGVADFYETLVADYVAERLAMEIVSESVNYTGRGIVCGGDAEALATFGRGVHMLSLRYAVHADVSTPVEDGHYALAIYHEVAAETYVSHGVLHRVGQPAVDQGRDRKEYWHSGRLHREDGPAIQNRGLRCWYRDGVRHREDGPAVESDMGLDEYWIDGVEVGDPSRFWLVIARLLYESWMMGGLGRERPDEVGLRLPYVAKGVTRGVPLRPAIGGDVFPISAFDRRVFFKKKFLVNPYPVDVLWYRLCRLSARLANGPETLSVGDRRDVIRLLEATASADEPSLASVLLKALRAVVPGPRTASPHGPVEFRFAWRDDHDGVGPLSNGVYVGRATIVLHHVDPSAAPVVQTLPAPDGSNLAVREIEGVLYRPILSPGSWEPVSERDFREWALIGPAWRDSPFSSIGNDIGVAALSIGDLCPAKAPRSRGAMEARKADEALLRAGRLIAVGGVVYRSTRAPRIVVACTGIGSCPDGGKSGLYKASARRIEVAWRFEDGLSNILTQETLPLLSSRRVLPIQKIWGDRYDGVLESAKADDMSPSFLCFEFGEMRESVECAMEMASITEIDFHFPDVITEGTMKWRRRGKEEMLSSNIAHIAANTSEFEEGYCRNIDGMDSNELREAADRYGRYADRYLAFVRSNALFHDAALVCAGKNAARLLAQMAIMDGADTAVEDADADLSAL